MVKTYIEYTFYTVRSARHAANAEHLYRFDSSYILEKMPSVALLSRSAYVMYCII